MTSGETRKSQQPRIHQHLRRLPGLGELTIAVLFVTQAAVGNGR